MSKIKNLMLLRNSVAKLTKEEIASVDEWMYDNNILMCVNAVHFDTSSETGFSEQVYTWFIPQSHHSLDIEIDQILVVEQLVGAGIALVKAVSNEYAMTREQHETNIHPYCQVIKNVGFLDQFLRQ